MEAVANQVTDQRHKPSESHGQERFRTPHPGAPEARVVHGRGEPQSSWAGRRQNDPPKEAVLPKEVQSSLGRTGVEPGEGPGLIEPLRNVSNWNKDVYLAAEDAELAQQSFRRGFSMEYHGATARRNKTTSSFHLASKSPSRLEESKAGPPSLQSERHDRDERDVHNLDVHDRSHDRNLDRSHDRNLDRKDECKDDNDKPRSRKDDEGDSAEEHDDETDEKTLGTSGSDSSTTVSTISGLEVLGEGFILDMIRTSGKLGPAMQELPK
ncbi:MAG: hypothetical protein Q9168_002857 [Polycauliona sp. 1 TL-2023]